MSLKYNHQNIERAKELRKNATRHENHLWYDFLSRYPVRFQRQKSIGNYIADFYCHKAKLVIELDGGQHFTDNEKEYDNQRTEYFESLGVSVLRFPNSDVDESFEGIYVLIDKTVKNRLGEG